MSAFLTLLLRHQPVAGATGILAPIPHQEVGEILSQLWPAGIAPADNKDRFRTDCVTVVPPKKEERIAGGVKLALDRGLKGDVRQEQAGSGDA